jgi:hypothetical protein
MGRTLMLLFGANVPGGRYRYLPPIATFHLIGLALAAAGLAVAVAIFFTRRMDRVSQIIVAGILATMAAGILGTELPNLTHAHEVAILLPFGAVLAGRMLPGLVTGLVPARWHPGRFAVPVLAVWLACGLAALCYAATWGPLAPQNQALANWLVEHKYTEGLAAYWQANSTTVTSGGKVLVATITPQATAVRHWEALADWYDPSHRRANFVIAVRGSNPAVPGLSTATVRASFGRPARQYQVGQYYVIMVYDYNLLTKLGGRTFPGLPGYLPGLRASTRNCLPSRRQRAGVCKYVLVSAGDGGSRPRNEYGRNFGSTAVTSNPAA